MKSEEEFDKKYYFDKDHNVCNKEYMKKAEIYTTSDGGFNLFIDGVFYGKFESIESVFNEIKAR